MRQFIKTCDLRNIVDDIACDEISKKREEQKRQLTLSTYKSEEFNRMHI